MRAVADGIVEDLVDGMPTNTITADADGNLLLPSPTPMPVSGNCFWVRHGDVLVLYAHLQAGTLPPSLLMKGAPISAGETLGLAGNSGNSSNPHTHIQCQRDSLSGPLRGMPFRDAWVLDRTRFNSANSNSLWVSLKADGIPQEAVAIWPGLWLPIRPFYEAAIDPLALILRGDVYIKLTLPDPPPERCSEPASKKWCRRCRWKRENGPLIGWGLSKATTHSWRRCSTKRSRENRKRAVPGEDQNTSFAGDLLETYGAA